LFASVATPAVAQQYQYVARTEAPALRQGAVMAGGLTWQCQGSACSIGGPWPAPVVGACAALAREVGRISAYGRQGNMLDAAALTSCNANVQAAAPIVRAPPTAVLRGPAITAPLRQPTAPMQITTSELNLIVGAPVVASTNTYAITTSELALVAGAPVAPSSERMDITTSELNLIVR
jgi:hypothetical protein